MAKYYSLSHSFYHNSLVEDRMKRNYLKLFLFNVLLLMLFLIGCSREDAVYTGERFEERLGAYTFGALLDLDDYEIMQFEFNGEKIEIPYHVEGLADNVISEFGWFLFVDGLPQPTQLESFDGEIVSEKSYMHHFSLGYREREEFYVVFSPVSGEMGGRVGLIAGSIFKPSFLPEDVNEPAFSPFHSLITTLPSEVMINNEVNGDFIAYRVSHLQPIDEKILVEEQRRAENEGIGFNDFLSFRSRIGLFPKERGIELNYEDILKAENGFINLTLLVYGGQEISSRITFFLNHEPVQINNGADFIEVSMEHGQMALIDVTLEIEDDMELGSLYALMMATRDEYENQDIFKTTTLLVVNE